MGVIVYKCVNCGGPLSFKAESQNWTCDYCLSEFTVEDVRDFVHHEEKERMEQLSSEELLRLEEEELEFAEKSHGFICKSCGAEIVTDDTTAATFCYYCHNPTIIPRRLEGEFRPEKVIPFKIDRNKATEMFIEWCKKKPLLPKFFTSASTLEYLSGIYVPFWLFDCKMSGSVKGEAIRIRSYTRGDTRYTETRFYKVERDGQAFFKAIPADGSKKLDDDFMQVLEPFDYNDLTDFSMSYLSGFFAEKYDMDQNEVYGRVANLAQQHMHSLLTDTINGYSSVRVQAANFTFHKVEATYALLPVWMFTYQYQGKTYMFAMNGQTGKIAGQLPISKKRAFAWFGGVASMTFVTSLLGGTFLW